MKQDQLNEYADKLWIDAEKNIALSAMTPENYVHTIFTIGNMDCTYKQAMKAINHARFYAVKRLEINDVQNSTIELEDCPFCGTTAKLKYNGRTEWSVKCTGCGATITAGQEVVDTWNKRHGTMPE